MSRGAALAWSSLGVTGALAAGRLALAVAHPASSDAASGPGVPGGGLPVAAFESIVLLALGALGALVAARRPRNAMGWVLCTASAGSLRPPGRTPGPVRVRPRQP